MTVVYYDANDRDFAIHRPVRPQGVAKPYEFVLPAADVARLYDEVNSFVKRIGVWQMFDDPPPPIPGLYGRCERKFITKGMRIEASLHGGSPLGKKQWAEVCGELQEIFNRFLGENAVVYAEKYGSGYNRGCSASFMTWIMYAELK